MNASLYEIGTDFLKALDGLEVDEDTGEIKNFDAVEALDAQFEDKAESVACYIKNLTAFAANLKAEEENLSDRRKTVERRVDSVKKYLSSCLASVWTLWAATRSKPRRPGSASGSPYRYRSTTKRRFRLTMSRPP